MLNRVKMLLATLAAFAEGLLRTTDRQKLIWHKGLPYWVYKDHVLIGMGRRLPAIAGASDSVRTPYTRVVTIEDRAGPANVPRYQGFARAMGPNLDFGGTTAVREPDPNRYGAFRVVDQILGEPGLPTLDLEIRHQFDLSEMLRIGRKNCPLDVQVRYGKCEDPRDLKAGWTKIAVLEAARITSWSTGDLGALQPGDDAVVNESVPTTGQDYYEIVKMSFGELAAAAVTRELGDVVICDSISCGACGIPSDGCKVFFALGVTAAGSPGLPADLMWSSDGGLTVTETNITTLGAAEDPDAMACVGTLLVVVSQDSGSIHYAPIADILLGTATWVEIATGITAPSGSPRRIFSLGSTFTWIVGAGGYVYFTDDPTAGVSVQNAGVATTQPLNAIHGVDELNLVAVGDSNAVIHTTNGGDTWSSVTGPAVGVVLNAVWMKSETEWFVGTAGGALYYTRNSGVTWTIKGFAGSGSGAVLDIVFATPTVGYMAHTSSAGVGRILRTVDGGYSWYVMPEEGGGTMPDNDRINAIAACGENVNIVYGAGLGGNTTDGFLVKGS